MKMGRRVGAEVRKLWVESISSCGSKVDNSCHLLLMTLSKSSVFASDSSRKNSRM